MEVLIIDDDELDRMAIIRAMRHAGVEVNFAQATTAQQGLILANAQRFDVVLLDFRLPDCDGIEVLKMLRSTDACQTAIVMLSQQEDETLAAQALEAGAQDFLLKDEVNSRRLWRAVYQAQHRYRLEEALHNSRNELRQLAECDPLTGLANRYDFERALQLGVGRASRGGTLAVLLLDVDRFKQVNDTFGHGVGDRLLIEVARRLKPVIRESDLLARLGGDEFVVLLQDLARDEQAILLAERIVASFHEPMLCDGISLRVTASIGIAVYGDSANNTLDLMKCADIALYRAKQAGRNQSHFYSKQLHQAVRKRMALERDIRNALAQQEFKLYYQAQIDAKNGRLIGLEALLRWEHPSRGVLLPADFLVMAEEIGLMPEIGKWVLQSACRQVHAWRHCLAPDGLCLAIAINLSAGQLQEQDLFETIDSALADSGLDAGLLELEITEHALIKNPQNIAAKLAKIAARGVRLSLDDFGTGFSSFEHLKLFPIHALKIDRIFVSGIGQGEAQDRLLAAMIRFAKALGLKVVAEGVETNAQAQFCCAHGCDFQQGYFYAEALPATEFESRFLLA
ncbi:EAL domain-containing protein [Shewanella sp. AS16]|uniref:putative bifunctional diguanylate cyclase/phosphodiesterase n=1 Tax=Shewanella sp. AS16 TaxID=2907625 RepID=UPI001F280F12|nr:GGDEF domain-containing response regulator [Shewanella sp. AS16]MCE9688000.1 EAL domain-containing protein [Shewanella sp. AS16]